MTRTDVASASPTDTLAPSHLRPQTRLGRARALVAMMRPAQIALIGLIFVNGLLLGAYRAVVVDWAGPVLIASLLLVASAAAVHLVNEASDHETDRLTRRTPFSGGSGALQASGLSRAVPLMVGLGLALGVASFTLLAATSGLIPSLAGGLLLVGLVGGLLYSLPPVAAMRRGWGEPLNALLGGWLLPLFGVALVTTSVTGLDILAFLPFTLVTLASVMATAWPDRAADAATGKATMQVRWPVARLRRVHLLTLLGFVAATLLAAAVGAMPLALAGLLVTPLLVVGSLTYTRRESPLPNVVAMVGLALITTVGLAMSLLWGTTA